ncbi:major facilitator superfamily transporter [Talaromyces proteolyticus]|uniref:Major facilitator superfamily transporter n=1 Tax=Talaromyces proteolyticus TaxID=1131652 RepID=A0AAD4KL15_9EURO|nr:major facilitator superfamily transporter [Talaromyces proteolyticus]KAH8693868.1 major facilitator superfamily transporter [Talaromyces proteolyticus]
MFNAIKKHAPVPARTSKPSHGQITDGFITFSDEDEKRHNREINRKLDLIMLPFLSFLYLFSGLDRGNIGNAETQGFTNDIGATADDLNLAVSLFFIPFVVFQPLSSAVGRQIGAKHWIPVIMICWGITTIAHAFIKGRGALITVRLLIGLFEAGFFPTVCFYLSTFYTRFDLGLRLALFYGNYAIAGAFSGALAYGIFQITGALKGWQYLFIIEGAITCTVGILAWFWLPSGPGSAWFLTSSQRQFVTMRVQRDNAKYIRHEIGKDGIEHVSDRLSKRDIVETAKDWKLWYALFFNICASVPPTAFSVFLPLVVKGMGYTSLNANLMTVPPYVCGAVGLYIFAFSSDRYHERGYHIVVGLLICLVGLVVLVTVSNNGGKYTGLCILLFGSYTSAPLIIAWLSGNTPEPGKRSLVIGVNGCGNLAGVVGAQLYRAEYAPKFLVPFFVTLCFVFVAMLGFLSYRFVLRAVNQVKARKVQGWTDQQIENERTSSERYADKKYTFVYGL